MKATCKQIVRNLPAYIEDGANAREYRKLFAHVQSCKTCGIVSDSVRRTMAMYADRRFLDHEPGLVQSVPVVPHFGK
jgi:hypothetical protein